VYIVCIQWVEQFGWVRFVGSLCCCGISILLPLLVGSVVFLGLRGIDIFPKKMMVRIETSGVVERPNFYIHIQYGIDCRIKMVSLNRSVGHDRSLRGIRACYVLKRNK
jgi:hypothetical protein